MQKYRRDAAASILASQLQSIAAAEGGPMTGQLPDRWTVTPTWRCTHLHVSRRFGGGRHAADKLCAFCGIPAVFLTFPEDRSGPLGWQGIPETTAYGLVEPALSDDGAMSA
jgi:hypothetical protein